MSSEMPPELREMGERLHAEARRRHEKSKKRIAVRRRVAAVGAAAALIVLTVGVILATGRPADEDLRDVPRAREPAQPSDAVGAPASVRDARVAVTQPDPYGGLAWGVGLYTDREGNVCAVIGRRQGDRLGELRDGAFTRLSSQTPGVCEGPGVGDVVSNVLPRGTDNEPRTIVYGRSGSEVARVVASTSQGRRVTDTGPVGAFLFVYDSTLQSQDVDLAPASASGG
jgi:hypothetical protein